MEGIMKIMNGAWAAEALYTASLYDIPAKLAGGPRHYTELAKEAGVVPEFLYRLLRMLTSIGVFSMDSQGNFSNTPVGTTAIEWRPMIIHIGEPFMNQVWGKLPECVKTGTTGTKLAFGSGVFDYYLSHPESFKAFNDAMTVMSKVFSAFVQAYDWSSFNKIVDVGGGHGKLAYEIVKKHSNISAVVFDLPQVIEGTKEAISKAYADVAGRITAVGGDFFKEVPTGGDLYVMKHILHDWSDEDSVKILQTIHKYSGDAKLLILEHVVPPDVANPYGVISSFLDVHMMVAVGGKERTAEQWKKLLSDGGYELETIKTAAMQNMIFANKKK